MKLRRKNDESKPHGALVVCSSCNRRHGRLDPCAVKVVRRAGLVLKRPEGTDDAQWERVMKMAGAIAVEGTDDWVAPSRADRRASHGSKRRADGTALTKPSLHARKATRRKADPAWPQKPTTRPGVSRKKIAA